MKILCATDGSEHSETAARFLTHLALTEADEIIVFNALSIVPVQDDWVSYYENLNRARQDVGRKIIDEAARILSTSRAKITTAMMDGAPDRSILLVAANTGVDLIVMGARGLKPFESVLLGSVTRSVMIEAPKSVLVVKPQTREIQGAMSVLFATDGSDHSRETEDLLLSMPLPSDSRIVIVNVISPTTSDIPERFAIEIDEQFREEVAKIRSLESAESERVIEEARLRLGKKFPSATAMTLTGDPAEQILSAAESMHADLIALGLRGLRGIRGMMGSVSRSVLSHASCSVFIGKGGER